MTPTFVCVLKSGGDFDASDVEKLRKGVESNVSQNVRFLCLSDVPVPCERDKLEKEYPGWWSVPEVFRIKGPVVFTGLDTVFTGSIDCLFDLALKAKENDFYMIKAFNKLNKWASGIMVWNGDWSWIWDEFSYPRHTRRFRGEQEHTIYQMLKHNKEIKTINKYIDGIYSYKWHCRNKLPSDSRIVLFHGNPRPVQAKAEWIGDYYDKN